MDSATRPDARDPEQTARPEQERPEAAEGAVDEGGENDTASSQSAPTPPRPATLTGHELEALWARRRAERRARVAARTPQDRRRRLRVVTAVLGAGVVAVAITTGLAENRHETATATRETQIGALNRQLADAQDALATEVSPAWVGALTDAALRDGEQVAAAQRRYAELLHAESTDVAGGAGGNGEPSPAMLATVEHRRVLAERFHPDALLVDEELAYVWTTVPLVDEAIEIDPRWPWYVRWDGLTAMSAASYTWHLDSVLPSAVTRVAGQPGVQVMWVCRDTASSTVLAWAAATYDTEQAPPADGSAPEITGTLRGLTVGVTTAGARHRLDAGTAVDPPPGASGPEGSPTNAAPGPGTPPGNTSSASSTSGSKQETDSEDGQ